MKKILFLAITVLYLTAGLSGLAIAAPVPAASVAELNTGSRHYLQDILTNLRGNLEKRYWKNHELSAAEKENLYADITENLLLLLRLRESTQLTDVELGRALPRVHINTRVVNYHGTSLKVRVVGWDGYPGSPCGTLSRFWTYVQWWDDKTLGAQVLSAKGSSTPEDFLVLPVGGRPTLILAEYSYVYRPRPWSLATWQIADDKWVKTPMFGPNVVADDTWNLQIFGNDVVIESKPQQPLEVAPNAQGDGFVFFVTADKSKAIELRVKDGLVVREE